MKQQKNSRALATKAPATETSEVAEFLLLQACNWSAKRKVENGKEWAHAKMLNYGNAPLHKHAFAIKRQKAKRGKKIWGSWKIIACT